MVALRPLALLSLALLSLALLSGCSSATVAAIVSVAAEAEPGTVTQPLEVAQRRDGLVMSPGERVSFTPSSLKLTLRGLYLCPHVVFEAGAGVKCPSAAPQVSVIGTPQEVELAGQAAMSKLLSFSASVGPTELGDYQGATLVYGVSDGKDGRATASGTVTRTSGESTTFRDLAITMGTGGIGLEMASPVHLVQGANATVRVFFDTESALELSADGAYPTSATTPDGLVVTLGHPILLPYVGEAEPTVEKYRVTLATDDFGARNTWYLKVDVLRDSTGAVATAGWRAVYVDGFRNNRPFQPGALYAQSLSRNADGSWSLKEDPSRTFAGGNQTLVFPAFQLANHQGTLTYGTQTFSYTARKLP